MFRTSSVHHQERFVQAVFADFGLCCNTRTTRHVQPLRLDVSSSTHIVSTIAVNGSFYSFSRILYSLGIEIKLEAFLT